MSDLDRSRWDRRYAEADATGGVGLPLVFADFAHEFPTTGVALELACGQGATAVWLADRGLTVTGYDVSPVAVAHARQLAARHDVTARCHVEVADLDHGIPPGPSANVIVCHKFRDPGLDDSVLRRLAPGGLLAIAALSEVGAEPGPFRISHGELLRAFGALDVIADGEGDGLAWLLARRGRHYS